MVARSTGEKLFAAFNALFLLFVALTMLIPMLSVLKDSLDKGGHADITINLIPNEFTFMYYRMVFMDTGVYRPFLNSILVTVLGTGIALFINALGAYTLSRRELPGNKFLVYFLVVIPMVFVGGGIIANYILFKAVGLLNTYWVIFLPTTVMGFWMIIIRTFYWNIPFSLTESAWLDGASEFTIFAKIISPMAKAVYAAMTLFAGVHYWNAWREAVLYVHDASKYTFPVKLRGMLFLGQDIEKQMKLLAEAMGVDPEEVLIAFEGLAGAIIIVAMIPILLIYPYLQKYFAQGVRIGAIKG